MTTVKSIPTHKISTGLSTLQCLRGGWYATWGISLLLLVISIQGFHAQKDALKTVGEDTVPSILLAQRLKDSFADMDASLANELLLKPGDREQAEVLKNFEVNRKKIAERLTGVAKNIVYKGEQELVQTLQLNGSAYLLKLQEARDTHKRGDTIGTLNIYRDAASLMDTGIITKAEEISKLNAEELNNKYRDRKNNNLGIYVIISILGIVQIAILVAVQIFLYRRMRRILNLPLLGATAISIIFLGYALNSLGAAASSLKIAKEDAYESLFALRQMRSLSYKANGDESRYLLDRVNAATHEQAFNTKIDRIIKLPSNKSSAMIIANVQQGAPTTELTGLFANALNNITFAGEREAAIETFVKFNDYLAIDKTIRQLYRSGKVAEAIALCIGNKPGQSNFAFDTYKDAQTRLIALNEKEFYRNIKIGNDRLANFEIIAAAALITVSILTLLGLRPRLMEYL
jgi:hypothetical protein